MTPNTQTEKPKTAYMGLGIALGAGLGLVFGQIFMGGDIVVGMCMGVPVGLVLGMITDNLGRPPLEAFIGILLGLVVGGMLGTVIGLAHGWYDASYRQVVADTLFGLPYKSGYTGLAALVISMAGMVAGVHAEVKKDRKA